MISLVFRQILAAVILLALPGSMLVAQPQAEGQVPGRIQDRVAAVVDQEIITLSDVQWLIRYRRLPIPEDPQGRRQLYETHLNQLVEQKLIAREAAQTPGVLVSSEDVEARLTGYRSQFPSEEAFHRHLEELEISFEGLRELIRRQLAVLQFVKVRFEPFIIVLPDQILRYFREELAPELERAGQQAPPLELVEEQIREILTVQRTNAEIERWAQNARRKAMVRILLFRSPSWRPNIPAEKSDEVELKPPFKP